MWISFCDLCSLLTFIYWIIAIVAVLIKYHQDSVHVNPSFLPQIFSKIDFIPLLSCNVRTFVTQLSC